MKEAIRLFSEGWNQPQLFSLAITVLIIFIISLAIFIKIKIESKPNKAPSKTLLIAEEFVNLISKTYDDTSSGKLPKGKFYIFALATFLLVGNMVGLIGLEPIATSYSVTLALAAISFLGIYVIGIWYQKFRFFLKYLKNPIEIIGQFSPLISLGFRMFGNIIAGSIIMSSVYYVGGVIWGLIFPGPQMYFFASIITPWMHMFFDIFGVVIQTLVFTVLTTIYWANEVEIYPKKNKKQKNQSKKLENPKVINLSSNIY